MAHGESWSAAVETIFADGGRVDVEETGEKNVHGNPQGGETGLGETGVGGRRGGAARERRGSTEAKWREDY